MKQQSKKTDSDETLYSLNSPALRKRNQSSKVSNDSFEKVMSSPSAIRNNRRKTKNSTDSLASAKSQIKYLNNL